ncbi:MAG: hypothetical protein H6713_11395 [Myxococcales bacterium]|nr:hypothetical protein [Myxococcales bacterium]MCB9750579.1 hypothetical protein [Myxococcales bacterium]
MSQEPVRFRIVSAEEGVTLRQLLPRRFDGMTRAQAGELVKAGGVYLNNVRVRVPSVRVCEGERVTVYREALSVRSLDPEELSILARGPDFVVVDKPRGVPVVATRASARGTVSQALVHLLAQEGVLRPYVGVVHGLERAASGVVLCTLRGQDTRSVHARFKSAACRRTFRVLVEGDAPASLESDRAVIVTPTGAVRLVAEGSPVTPVLFRRLEVITPGDLAASLMEVTLERGPSEQIRLLADALGYPVVELPYESARASARASARDDARRGPYRGSRSVGVARALAVHASALEFTHPITGELIRASAPEPAWAKPSEGAARGIERR